MVFGRAAWNARGEPVNVLRAYALLKPAPKIQRSVCVCGGGGAVRIISAP